MQVTGHTSQLAHTQGNICITQTRRALCRSNTSNKSRHQCSCDVDQSL